MWAEGGAVGLGVGLWGVFAVGWECGRLVGQTGIVGRADQTVRGRAWNESPARHEDRSSELPVLLWKKAASNNKDEQ